MKRVFGIVEVIFDIVYLCCALVLGIVLIVKGESSAQALAGVMALILACGDATHLIPRINLILTQKEERLGRALGRGKQITSITMTVYYILLWNIGQMAAVIAISPLWSYTVYILAGIRIVLCLLPQNQWTDRFPPVKWGIMRNIPFFMVGIIVSARFFMTRNMIEGMGLMWLAIILSFAFYLPVVLWSNRNPKVGMLMLPKSCVYLWMLVMCLQL